MGIEINGFWMYTFLFADDQLVVTSDQKNVAYITIKSLENKRKKTKYLCVGKASSDL